MSSPSVISEAPSVVLEVERQGPPGPSGQTPALQNNGIFIQYKYPSDEAWTNLVALSDLQAPNAITSETTSDGTASISLSTVTATTANFTNLNIPDASLSIAKVDGLQSALAGKQATLTDYSTISALAGYPLSFPNDSVTAASAGGNGAADEGKLAKFGADGSLKAEQFTFKGIPSNDDGFVVPSLVPSPYGWGSSVAGPKAWTLPPIPDNVSSIYLASTAYVIEQVVTKQDTLVSGTNIKMVNGVSLLGSGNIEVGVTNANLVTAIEEDPAAVRVASELLSPVIVGHDEAIVHFMDQLMDLKLAPYPADGKYLVVGGGGDSMGTSSGFNPYVCMELTRRFGAGAIASETFQGANSFGSGQFATTITPNNLRVQDNFQYLPNGDYYAIPAGGTLTEIPGSANIHAGFVRVRCWYAFRTGGGTITMTVTQNGVSLTPVVVNTGAGSAGAIGYADFILASPNGKPTLVVASADGTSHYLGTYFYLSKGFVPVAVGRGGSSYAQQLAGNAANLNTFCEAMGMRLCFHAVKEEDATWDNLRSMMDRWAAQHPLCSHVWVGATPSPTGEAESDPGSNAAMRAKAMVLKMCFVDGQRLLRSTAYLRTIGRVAGYGWNEPPSVGNGYSTVAPHLSQVACRFIASYILNKVLLGLNTAGERFDKTLISPEGMGRPVDLGTQRYQAMIWAWTMSNVGTNTFTQTSPDLGRMTINVPAGIPAASSGAVGKFSWQGPQLNNRQVYAYRISDGALIDNLTAVIMVGGANQNDAGLGMTSNNFGGIRIIHGVDTISATLVPWVRLAVKGVGTSEQLSPKIYHSSATGAAPYSGGTWRNTENFYWVEYIGNGASTTKRLRVWHQPTSNGSSESRLAAPRLIADWSATITLGHNQEPQTWFGVVSTSTPNSTGANPRVISLQNFTVDLAPRENTDLGMPDLNY